MSNSRSGPRPVAVLALLAAGALACQSALSFVTGYSSSAGRAASRLPRGLYEKTPNVEYQFIADEGYFADGTSIVKAGNMKFRPAEADPHTDGAPLPKSHYVAEVGYFVDGTSIVKAGNMAFRPPEADPHTPGSPLPPSEYIANIGYFSDGTPIDRAGNDGFRNA